MQNAKRTSVTEHNRHDFYRKVYPVQTESRENLVDLSAVKNPVIAIDCCGWHYAKMFDRPIIMLETVISAKNYKLSADQFTKLIDDRSDNLHWPRLDDVVDAVVVLDRSPLLKYLTMSEFIEIINTVSNLYKPIKIIIRGNLAFIDDSRLQDRFYSWQKFHVKNYVILNFEYNVESMLYSVALKRCL